MALQVGQKVVCVDDEAVGRYLPSGFKAPQNFSLHGLKGGKIYTIRSLNVVLGVPVCRLDEITRDFEPYYGEEAYFAQARFRPVVERKTDISIFTAMLTGTKKRRVLAQGEEASS